MQAGSTRSRGALEFAPTSPLGAHCLNGKTHCSVPRFEFIVWRLTFRLNWKFDGSMVSGKAAAAAHTNEGVESKFLARPPGRLIDFEAE